MSLRICQVNLLGTCWLARHYNSKYGWAYCTFHWELGFPNGFRGHRGIACGLCTHGYLQSYIARNIHYFGPEKRQVINLFNIHNVRLDTCLKTVLSPWLKIYLRTECKKISNCDEKMPCFFHNWLHTYLYDLSKY